MRARENPKTQRPRQKPLEPAERRNSITAAAALVFSGKGYHRASVSDIVEAAGVARGTFYLYFDGKRQVFEAILDEVLAHINVSIARIDPASPAGVFEQVRENVRRVMDLFLDRPELARVYLNQSAGFDPDLDAKIAEFDGRLAAVIARSLRAGREMGLVRSLDERIVAFAILGGVKEVVFQVMGSMPEGALPVARDTVLNELLAYHLHALLENGVEGKRGGGRDPSE